MRHMTAQQTAAEEQNDSLARIRKAFDEAQIDLLDLNVRKYPSEAIYIASVQEKDFARAVELASKVDDSLSDGFITVKKTKATLLKETSRPIASLADPRVTDLVEVLNARSRTSEQQPSLRYVVDAAQNLNVAASRRHHLIFGRRGVGKTALMLEARKLVESRGSIATWINVQTIRGLDANNAFLTCALRFCELPEIYLQRRSNALSVQRSAGLKEKINALLGEQTTDPKRVDLMVPELQQMLQIFTGEIQEDIFIFLDDIHYLSINELPPFLDKIHAITRDNPIWIKATGIKHQCRWFSQNPPTGLQTGHDASMINLDVTLEQPSRAKDFLSSILKTYTDEIRIGSVSGVIPGTALDRLVLASGGVPRDFLVLSATALQVARERPNARSVGVQDVNEAAGRTAKIKLQELDDDAASSFGSAPHRQEAVKRLREFLLDDEQATFFRVDFRDKEQRPKDYELLQSLMDLRFIHLINASLSDERHAGRRAEVYMLDLSQFSGSRFKHHLRVLDFTKGYLVLKNTGSKAEPKPGDTPKRLLGILRRGPLFPLEVLEMQVDQEQRPA